MFASFEFPKVFLLNCTAHLVLLKQFLCLKIDSPFRMIAAEKWSLNAYDRDSNLAIDPDGLLCQSRDPQKWNGARCNRGVFGKGNSPFVGAKG